MLGYAGLGLARLSWTLVVVGSVVAVDGLALAKLHRARAARAVAIPTTLATCPTTRDHLPLVAASVAGAHCHLTAVWSCRACPVFVGCCGLLLLLLVLRGLLVHASQPSELEQDSAVGLGHQLATGRCAGRR